MEKLSRVKKYEELRNSIETDNNVDQALHADHTEEQTEALRAFDSTIFKKVDIKEETAYAPTREKTNTHAEEKKSVVDDTFTNEYLDDFIREVREYNIKKGNRESENTQVDILSQLNASNRAKRARYIEDIKEEIEPPASAFTQQEIAAQVQDLLREEELPIQEEPLIPANEDIYATREMMMEQDFQPEVEKHLIKREPYEEETPIVSVPEKPVAKKILQPVFEDVTPFMANEHKQVIEKPKDTVLHKKLLEETQQLRVQMDEYEDELTDLSDGVEKNNKLLNFILCFLILVLLVIIGFIGYTIWKAGGF